MLVSFWQLSSRVLDEQEYGYAHLEESLSAAHQYRHQHHHSHQHYPSNYFHHQQLQQLHCQTVGDPSQQPPKIRTPAPKLPSPRVESFVIAKTDKLLFASKASTPESSTDYKSLPISPLDIHGSVPYMVS